MPCADCGGLRTELTLYAKGPDRFAGATFFLRETYIGAREGDKRTFESRGEWTILRGSGGDRNATSLQAPIPARKTRRATS